VTVASLGNAFTICFSAESRSFNLSIKSSCIVSTLINTAFGPLEHLTASEPAPAPGNQATNQPNAVASFRIEPNRSVIPRLSPLSRLWLLRTISFVLCYFSEFRTRNLPPFHQVRDLFYMMSCSRLAVGSHLTMQSQCALRNANQIVVSLIVDCPIVRRRSTCEDTWMANPSEFQMRSRSHPLDRDKGRLRGGRLEAHRAARLLFRGLSRRA
jgi:hypothetical protein